jgi:hypothetical protein
VRPTRVMHTHKRRLVVKAGGGEAKRRRVVFTNGETEPAGVAPDDTIVDMRNIIMTGSNMALDDAIRVLCYNGIRGWHEWGRRRVGAHERLTAAVGVVTETYGDVDWVIDACDRLAGLSVWYRADRRAVR